MTYIIVWELFIFQLFVCNVCCYCSLNLCCYCSLHSAFLLPFLLPLLLKITSCSKWAFSFLCVLTEGLRSSMILILYFKYSHLIWSLRMFSSDSFIEVYKICVFVLLAYYGFCRKLLVNSQTPSLSFIFLIFNSVK